MGRFCLYKGKSSEYSQCFILFLSKNFINLRKVLYFFAKIDMINVRRLVINTKIDIIEGEVKHGKIMGSFLCGQD